MWLFESEFLSCQDSVCAGWELFHYMLHVLQVTWVWFIIISCSALLAASILAAVAAFISAAFAVLPSSQHAIMIVPVSIGGAGLLIATLMLALAMWTVRGDAMGDLLLSLVRDIGTEIHQLWRSCILGVHQLWRSCILTASRSFKHEPEKGPIDDENPAVDADDELESDDSAWYGAPVSYSSNSTLIHVDDTE